jgi:hypothetical protein
MRCMGISVGIAAASTLLSSRLEALTGLASGTVHAAAPALLSAGRDVILLLCAFAFIAGAMSMTQTHRSPSGGAKDVSG